MNQLICTAAALAIAGVAGAATETQTFDMSVNPGEFAAEFQLRTFDTMGGTRELTGVRLITSGSLTGIVGADNIGTTAVEPGDWEIIPEWTSFFNVDDGAGDPGDGLRGSYFRSFGGFRGQPLTGFVPGGDGGGPFGNPGMFREEVTGPMNADLLVTDASVLAFFSTDGMLEYDGSIAPFSAPQFETGGNELLAFVGDTSVTGSLTVVYEFVPSPGAAALFGLAGLSAMRRRR